MRVYTNFFLPVMKCRQKVRVNGKVKRIYDDPRTSYARALECEHLSDGDKAELRETYGYLSLISLRRQIDGLLDQLQHTLLSQ